jgi:hypothetical protein
LKQYKQGQLRWMFRHAKIAWTSLLQASVRHVLKHYNLTSDVLVVDDTNKQRSKITSQIMGTHKVKDKKTGSYFNGQELIFMVLVNGTLSIPVAFCFYTPDPEMSHWRKENKRLKRQGEKLELGSNLCISH